MKINILPLTMRRERNDLLFFGKCMKGIYEIDIWLIMYFFQIALIAVPVVTRNYLIF